MAQHRSLSVNGFKDWLSVQKDVSDFFNIGLDRHDESCELIGKFVKARAPKSKLIEKIECDTDDPHSIIDEFLREGGTILEVHNRKFLIEVDSGSFLLPRFFVKVKKG